MARLGALLALCQALGRFRVRVMLLNLAEGSSIASNVKGGCRATPPEQLAWLLLRLSGQSSAIPWPKPWELWCAAFKGSDAAFVEA